MPEFDDGEARPSLALPPVLVPPEAPRVRLAGSFVLRGVILEGPTVFDDATLAQAVAPFLDREVHAETLPAITDAITRRYVEAGYVSSGAIVPEQTIESGLLTVQVIEGRVTSLEIENAGRLRDGWIEDRVARATSGPFSLPRLDETLRILQRDPRIARVDAVVVPAERLGQTRLRLRVAEARAWTLEGRVANDLAPSLGGRRITGTGEHRNVLGWGDTFGVSTSGGRGLFDTQLRYRLPVGPFLTELEVHGSYAEGEVVEGAFADVGFRNEIASYGVNLVQPIWRGLEDEARLVVGVERRTSELTFGTAGVPFQLEVNGDDGDVIRLFLLRLDADWVHREADRVLAARVRATFGLDAWDASSPNDTPSPAGAPIREPTLADGEFQAMLLQLQYAQRIETPLGPGEVIARSDVQVASGSLFSLEAFAMGGSTTVRGYAENAVVADNGTLASLEVRVPVSPSSWRPHALRLAPFVDFGFAWDDHDDVTSRFTQTYASLGLGLLYDYGERFRLRAYVAEGLVNEDATRDEALQRRGIHLEATLAVF
ncbi:MAG: POTRA domain-containing protein [Myxococcota bacterium]